MLAEMFSRLIEGLFSCNKNVCTDTMPTTLFLLFAGIVKHHIRITETDELRVIAIGPWLPSTMERDTWKFEDFEITEELYRGYRSLVYAAMDDRSGLRVCLKLYKKRKLSSLNRQVILLASSSA